MTRQVDVKALVSHVIRGDGVNRCRICMGDTSEGQVQLGDTVIMDGDRPVTLSELLETVTGIKVCLQIVMFTILISAVNGTLFRYDKMAALMFIKSLLLLFIIDIIIVVCK